MIGPLLVAAGVWWLLAGPPAPPPSTPSPSSPATTPPGPSVTASSNRWGPWVDLFDGASLEGWIRRGGRATYHVEDGSIVGRTVPRDPNTFLCTPAEYADFELTYEFKVDPELNSGVQIRSHSRPEYRDGRVHGYQIEIDPSPRAWTGGLYEEGRRGWLQSLPDEHPGRKAFRAGEWNRVRVVAVGRRIRTWLNGVPVVDFVDDAPEAESTGFIGLQVHGVGAREDPLEVRWRGLRIREPVRTDAKPARDSPRPDDREPRGGRPNRGAHASPSPDAA